MIKPTLHSEDYAFIKREYMHHDNYEDFAERYLGVDYEDLVNLQLGLVEDDDNVIEYEIPSFV